MLLVLFVCSSAVQATSVVEVTMEELLQNSALVFEGQVTAVKVHENGNHHIWTRITFEVSDVINGGLKGRIISLNFLGGEVTGRKLSVSNMHMPALHEKGIYFVESLQRNQVNPLYGWSQGHLRLEKGPAGTERVYTRSGRPVRGVEPTSGKRSGRLSHGAAHGLLLGEVTDVSSALDHREFKRLLREMQ